MKINKKLASASILIFTLILLLSTIAYARPFTDAFTNGLVQINNFFAGQQYKPYSMAIDFFFFALLFISIYLIGVRYAFKEVKRPEQVIAILLGLMTAFLLVIGGFSATILLPYMNWLLYLLLFMLYWWLLKSMKSKLWRFLLALLLTLLTIGLMQGLFGALSAPDIRSPDASIAGGFFTSLGKSFGSIKFPETIGVPGVPDYLQNLFGFPSAPTGPELSTLPPVPTPAAPPSAAKPEDKGLPWWAWLLILAALVWGYRKRAWLKEKGKGLWEWWKNRHISIEKEINDIIEKKTKFITKINEIKEEKNQIIAAADKKVAYLGWLKENKDIAYIWEEAGKIEKEKTFEEAPHIEIRLIGELRRLQGIELDFESRLDSWKGAILKEKSIDITKIVSIFRTLINEKNPDQRKLGIMPLILFCYNYEKRELILSNELKELLKEENIKESIEDKLSKITADESELVKRNEIENKFLKLLEFRIKWQIRLLLYLKRKISGPTQTPPQPTPSSPVPPSAAQQPARQPTARIRINLLRRRIVEEKTWIQGIREAILRRREEATLKKKEKQDLQSEEKRLKELGKQLELFEKTLSDRAMQRAKAISDGISKGVDGAATWLMKRQIFGRETAEISEQLELFDRERVEALEGAEKPQADQQPQQPPVIGKAKHSLYDPNSPLFSIDKFAPITKYFYEIFENSNGYVGTNPHYAFDVEQVPLFAARYLNSLHKAMADSEKELLRKGVSLPVYDPSADSLSDGFDIRLVRKVADLFYQKWAGGEKKTESQVPYLNTSFSSMNKSEILGTYLVASLYLGLIVRRVFCQQDEWMLKGRHYAQERGVEGVIDDIYAVNALIWNEDDIPDFNRNESKIPGDFEEFAQIYMHLLSDYVLLSIANYNLGEWHPEAKRLLETHLRNINSGSQTPSAQLAEKTAPTTAAVSTSATIPVPKPASLLAQEPAAPAPGGPLEDLLKEGNASEMELDKHYKEGRFGVDL